MFRQQLLPPSSGIGNSFESAGKQFHLDISPNGFSFLVVKQNQTSRRSKTLINIPRFPPFNVPTKCTNNTRYYNSHFIPTCFGITMPSSRNTSAS